MLKSAQNPRFKIEAYVTRFFTGMHLITNKPLGLFPMKKNVGNPDRIVRIIAGLVVAFFVLNGTISGAIGTTLAIVAVLLIGTGVISFCPLYAMLGLTSRAKGEESKTIA